MSQFSEFGWTPDIRGTVIRLQPGSVAERAGLQVGDQIRAIGGDTIESFIDLLKALKKERGMGEEISMEVLRGNDLVSFSLVAPSKGPSRFAQISLFEALFGIFLATFVLLKKPHRREAIVFYLLVLVSSITVVGAVNGIFLVDLPPLPYVWIALFPFSLPLLAHFLITFLKDKGISTEWYSYLLLYLPPSILSLIYAVTYFHYLQAPQEGLNDAAILQRLIDNSLYTYIFWTGYWILFSILLVVSYNRAKTVREKKQFGWILMGGGLSLAFPIAALVQAITQGPSSFFYSGMPISVLATSFILSVCLAFSIFRYRLMDIDLFFSRGVVYLLVGGIVIGLYFALVSLLSWTFHEVRGNPSHITLIVVTLLIATLVSPIEKGIRHFVDRRFYRDRYRSQQVLQALNEKLTTLLKQEELLESVGETLNKAFPISHVAIFTRSTIDGSFDQSYPKVPDGTPPPNPGLLIPGVLIETRKPIVRFKVENEEPNPEGPKSPLLQHLERLNAELVIPLFYEKRLLGWIVLGEKRFRDLYSSEEMTLLSTLANEVAIALQNASAYEALKDSHRKIEELNKTLQEKVKTIESQKNQILTLQEELLKENVILKEEIREQSNFDEIIGSAPSMQSILKRIEKVAATNSSVLIRGESGTGKELIARAIHYHSPRKEKPFIKVNCAALSPGVLESELFGHERGAFTGAFTRKEGRFELADGGTLFLDEIGDIPLDTQIRLLRVLQEKEFERVGGKQTIKADVRVVAATHQDLETKIARGEFREDLFYRLNVISLEIPPLRERRGDIYPLVLHFMKKYNRETKKGFCQIEDAALEYLQSYSWPGNVRELENVIERAIVLGEGEILRKDDFVGSLRHPKGVPSIDLFDECENGAASLEERMRGLEKKMVEEALRKAEGNKTKAAKRLGMNRTTFLYKLKALGLEKSEPIRYPQTLKERSL